MNKSVLCAIPAMVLLMGCGGGGKAGAGDYKLKISVNPSNGGSISIDPNKDTYNEWEDVSVTATPEKGYVFDVWTGDAADKTRSVTIKMSGNKNKKLTANFKKPTPFKDSRDGKSYMTVGIGKQVWMAENLNFQTGNSKCYGNDDANCQKYGRLYDWNTAKTACPSGWHLPSDAEWTQLTDFVGGSSKAGTKLKSSTGWANNGNGTDEYGFSALPGGYGKSDGNFYNAGRNGSWWSADNDAPYAWYRGMDYDVENVRRDSYVKASVFSVRCVQD